MKLAFGIVLFSVILLCSDASPQRSRGRCPATKPAQSFGICSFDPNINCLEDSSCKGGQICCPDGCNKVCKDPEVNEPSYNRHPSDSSSSMMVKYCPQPSGQFGICSYDENVNCLSDDQCKNGQLCCSEGCNKVCKDPVTFQPLNQQSNRPNFSNSGRRQYFY